MQFYQILFYCSYKNAPLLFHWIILTPKARHQVAVSVGLIEKGDGVVPVWNWDVKREPHGIGKVPVNRRPVKAWVELPVGLVEIVASISDEDVRENVGDDHQVYAAADEVGSS